MPTHTQAKRKSNRAKLSRAKSLVKSVASNRKAGAKLKPQKTLSGLARNAAASNASRRARRRKR